MSDLFKCLGICHACQAICLEGSVKKVYTGPSIDEVCLLDMAKDACEFGYFEERDSENIYFTNGKLREAFKVLKVNDFTSDRKCMSSIVEEVATGKVFVFVKGADSFVQKMLKTPNSTEEVAVDAVLDDIEDFSSKGLRTLMFAMRELRPDELPSAPGSPY